MIVRVREIGAGVEHNTEKTQELSNKVLVQTLEEETVAPTKNIKVISQHENVVVEDSLDDDGVEQIAQREEGEAAENGEGLEAQNVPIIEFGYGKRTTSLLVKFKDYVFQVVCDSENATGDYGEGIDSPILIYIGCSKFSYKSRYFLAAVIAGTEPTTFHDVVSGVSGFINRNTELMGLWRDTKLVW